LFVRSFLGKLTIGLFALGFGAIILWLLGADMGSVAEWFGAVGAIFAAAAALSIATRDRRERHNEREEADLAQMRLVHIEILDYNDSSKPYIHFRARVTNYGQRPILQAQVISAELFTKQDYEGRPPWVPSFKLADPSPEPPLIPVISHVEQAMLIDRRRYYDFLLRLADSDGFAWHPAPLGEFGPHQ
jgi:hypothetical protein